MVTSRKSRKRLEHGAIKRESISTVTVYDKKKKNKKVYEIFHFLFMWIDVQLKELKDKSRRRIRVVCDEDIFKICTCFLIHYLFVCVWLNDCFV